MSACTVNGKGQQPAFEALYHAHMTCHHHVVTAHCAVPGALPDYLEEQGDLVEGTDYQALLTSAIQLFHKFGEHKTWRWFPDQDAMCLTQAEFRLVHECCVPA